MFDKVPTETSTLISSQIGSAAWNKASKEIIGSAGLLGIYEGLIKNDLASNGAYEGGDDCLSHIGDADNLILLSLGGSAQPTAEAFQTLLRWYPNSSHALEAKSWLLSHQFPVPPPSSSP